MSKKEQKTKVNRVASKKEVKKRNKRKAKEPEKEKSFFGKLFGTLLLWILILLLIFAGVFCLKTYQNGWGIKGALMTAFFVDADDMENLETINIVLLGISEDLNTRLTDTIMLCSYNPKNAKISLISIPRDTYAGEDLETAIGNDKLNVLFSKNKERFLKVISNIVGVDVKYYAVINNKALIEIVDILGGVEFDIPIDMDYDDPTQDLHIHLKKGMQKVNGEEAEQLLRFRHNNDGTSYPGNYGDNDFGRMKTQRAFMEATAKQLISFRNLIYCRSIYDTVIRNVETNYEIKNVKKYIPTIADFDFNKITSKQLPGESERHNDLWFFVQDKEKTKELIKELEIK